MSLNLHENLSTKGVVWMQELERSKGPEVMKRAVGNLPVIREWLAMGYKACKKDIALEDLPIQDKRQLWDESLLYCPNDRVEWCEAIRFFECAKQ